jgi:signal transduction histidine kinase
MDPESAGPLQEWLVDALVAIALAALSVSSLFLPDPSITYRYPSPDAALVALTLLASLPLAFRRRKPSLVFGVCLTAVAVVTVSGWNTGITPICLVFALYASASWQRLVPAVVCLVGLYAVFLVASLVEAPYFETSQVWILAGTLTLVWGAGVSVRLLRASREEAVRRAARAERDRAAAAVRATLDERLRIARELHDVVAHTMSVIAVQSGVARHLLGPGSGGAVDALAAIEDASRTALDDLRRVVGLLRTDDGADASLVPSPGIDEVRLLVDAHRAAHGPVRFEVAGAVDALPESMRLTVYRVVQEALTNARKYAPAAPARVSLRTVGGGLTVEIDNDAATAPATPAVPGAGFGLAGMRERVALYGGDLTAGPRADGGWSVRAVLHDRADSTPVAT